MDERQRVLELVERYGWIWVFMGDLPEAERPPIPVIPEAEQPGWRALHGEFTWNAHYARVVENGVDIAHTPFVHRNSFGNPEHPEIEDHVVVEDEWSCRTSTTTNSSPCRPIRCRPPTR